MDNLSDNARQLRNAYQRNWMKNNHEKVKQYQISYWERRAAASYTILKARELHGKGLTQRKIAEVLGLLVGSINKLLKFK